jgi:hypothetical protein
LAVGVALALGACSSDDDAIAPEATAQEQGEATMTFSCVAPTMGQRSDSRAYSDGHTACYLYYAAYAINGTDTVLTETNVPGFSKSVDRHVKFDDSATPRAEVSIGVIVGAQYRVAFFACAEEPDGDPYGIDAEGHMLNVSYDTALCNDESRDAFWKVATFVGHRAEDAVEVTLRRPLAQVNLGVLEEEWDSYEKYDDAADLAATKTEIIVRNAYTKMNLITGEVYAPQEVEFDLATIPSESEVFPLKSGNAGLYRYLAMSYVLVNDKETFTVELGTNKTATTGAYWRVPNVPLQRNYRTNIIGSDLWYMDHTFTVEIDNMYDGDYTEEVDFFAD